MALPQLMRLSQGKLLAGGTEHILNEPSEGTGLVGGATGGDTLYHGTYGIPSTGSWLLLHALDISALSDIPANWLLRPGFFNQFMADLKNAGGHERVGDGHGRCQGGQGDAVGGGEGGGPPKFGVESVQSASRRAHACTTLG